MQVWQACGLAVLVVVLLAWASRNEVMLWLSVVMALGWFCYNVPIWFLGFAESGRFAPWTEGTAAMVVAAIGSQRRSWPAFVVLCLYGAEEVAMAAGHIVNGQGSYFHFALLNGIFALRLFTVGGLSGAYLVAWLHGEHLLSWRDPLGWARAIARPQGKTRGRG